MKTRKVYIVTGTCGGYSERASWPVIIFEDEKEANEYAVQCNAYADEYAKLSMNHWRKHGEFIESQHPNLTDQKLTEWHTNNPIPKYENPFDSHQGEYYNVEDCNMKVQELLCACRSGKFWLERKK